jgi:DNA-binding transcriptional MerR regulator/methylmalonyl-CoA mutase cobalamin-binding subunit
MVSAEHNTVNIAAVERDTGLSKDTLRVWERRYGFPAPKRDGTGQRVYGHDDVTKLRLAKRLLDYGYRPGKILALPVARLQQMAEAAAASAQPREREPAEGVDIELMLGLVLAHRIDELRRQLAQCLLRLGLAKFVAEVIAPLNARVGDAWARGKLEIFEEHLCTEAIQGILRNAISGIPRPGVDPPIVLLTTFPRETHGLGLLMAEAFFAVEGCRCISLGTQTPVRDIARAARMQKIDIIALSFSDTMNINQAASGIEELRSLIPAEIAIWVGGACPILERRPIDGVERTRQLADIGPALARLRRERSKHG